MKKRTLWLTTVTEKKGKWVDVYGRAQVQLTEEDLDKLCLAVSFFLDRLPNPKAEAGEPLWSEPDWLELHKKLNEVANERQQTLLGPPEEEENEEG